MKQLGYVQDAVLTASQGLPSIPAGATYALIQAEAQSIRWRDDGVDPTASTGMLLTAGSSFMYSSGPLANVRVIEATGGAVVNVSYYR